MGGYTVGVLLGLVAAFVRGQAAPPSNVLQSCTFEPGQSCSLQQQGSNFQITTAKKLWATGIMRPKYDVTMGNKQGHFAYTSSQSGPATYYTTLPLQQGSVCVRFWHMGDCPGYETKAYMVSGSKKVGLFEVEDQEHGLWRLQQKTITLSSSETYTLEIVVTYDGPAVPSKCTIAIDDYQLTQGACTGGLDGIPVRLVGGADTDEGRVEVQWKGQWGAICKNGFGWSEAITVCRALGKTGGRIKNLGGYGRASRMWLDRLKCPNYGAASLADCHHEGWGQVSCKPGDYAKVRCNVQEAPSASNRIRLADIKMSGNSVEGRVEVRQGGKWGSVCANQFDNAAAGAVCRMFGFNGSPSVKFGVQGQSRAILSSVQCNTGEVDYFNCKRKMLGSSCSTQAVVGCSYDVRHFPYTCSYDNGPQCSFTQLSNDDSDWTMGTDSSLRSLIKCNSQASEEGTCNMLSETIDTPPFSARKCLRFDYYVSDKNAGQLNVYIRTPNGERNLVMWTAGQDGQRTQGSFSAQRDIFESTFEVEFEATSDPKYMGYIGIRGLSVTAGLCSGDSLPSTPTPRPTKRPVPTPGSTGTGRALFMCDFEQSDCPELTNKPAAKFNWTRKAGRTPSSSTGPNTDRTGNGNGYYTYIETSSPRLSGDKAILQTAMYTATPYKRCVKLWYHMYGSDIGSLNIYWGSTNIGTYSGNKGQSWMKAEFDVPAGVGGQLKIEGVRGKDYRGDIAIDDVQLIDGPCLMATTAPVDPCASYPCMNGEVCQASGNTYRCISSGPGQVCNFDKKDDMCGLTEVTLTTNPTSDGKANWLWKNGRTPSSSTGPSFDHTTKKANSGGFVYFEASGKQANSVHTLESKPYPTGDTLCLEFYYHMYGSDMGRFIVKAKGDSGSFTQVKAIPAVKFGYEETYGNKTVYDKWLPFEETVTRSGASTITLSFDVICGRGYRSDVAIDDLSVKTGRC